MGIIRDHDKDKPFQATEDTRGQQGAIWYAFCCFVLVLTCFINVGYFVGLASKSINYNWYCSCYTKWPICQSMILVVLHTSISNLCFEFLFSWHSVYSLIIYCFRGFVGKTRFINCTIISSCYCCSSCTDSSIYYCMILVLLRVFMFAFLIL